MSPITIKKASIEDLETIKNVGRETFYETFAKNNSEEEMQKYLDESFSEEKLKKEINTPDSQFFIAWDENNPIGYLKINTGAAQTELQDETSLEIERIYVKSSHQGKKVGQILYDKALEIAGQERKEYIWLGVWEENLKAVNFYKKNGFVEFDKHIFVLGTDEQTDLMMKKILK
ncbi:GNAT family acetyltransferase [Chryseobacterium sp. IHB B 17019]|jgi:ribosomal protein S18 acetylase RimI-like enzyme|uniref:GNAT family N-acetyltransferase n=1 Tax=Chryseobacterium sp. IHB B 17019 TaxID=1721091 RepID=UPI00071F7EA0|nr:GNAT family N-acetyltransferase [Chryseobacterium sp. IHB B 17019]ALR30345.1 GNAT family acetyltransferase [Chryseobacterium sp. IHB B 17019]